MKTIAKIMLLAAAFFLAAPVANAQMKDSKLKKELNKKVDSDSRKEAKKLVKDGWQVMPGKLPIEKQIQATKYAELDKTPDGQKRFFVGTHKSVGGNYTAARQIADDRARVELARSIHAEVAQKIEQQVSNTDYGQGDIKVIDEFVSANKSVISAQLQGVVPTLEIYRPGKDGQYEVMVALKVEAAQALKDAKRGLTDGLKKKSDKLAKDLDKILPY